MITRTEEFEISLRQKCQRYFKFQTLVLVSPAARKYDITDVPPEVAHVVSHAVQERLRTLLEKLSTIAEHRQEIYKVL